MRRILAFPALLLPSLLTSPALADGFGSGQTNWVSVHVVLDAPCVVETLDLTESMGSVSNVHRSRRHLEYLRKQHALVGSQVEFLGGEVTANLMRLANALQVRIPLSRLDRVMELSGVVRVEPVPVYERSLSSAVPFVSAPQAWESLFATGKGVKVGIIDTGIDYLHADFGGSGNPADFKSNDRTIIEPGTFPTAKVAGGWDFVGDTYDGYNSPNPDPDPLDCFEEESVGVAGGHGTHVAGIAAGYGVNLDGSTFSGSYLASLEPTSFKIFPGVAPEATLYALKVFGCDGGTDMVAQAIEWAVDPDGDGDLSDHLDVLNLSLGGSYGLQSSTEASLISNASLAGILLVVAAGNDGDVFFVTGEPATYKEVLSVAATVDEISYLAMRIDSPAAVAGNVPCAEGSFSVPLATTGPMTGKLVATIPSQACSNIENPQDLQGNIAFIQRGDCYFVDKVQRAADAGAIAVVVVNNIDQEPFKMGGDGSQKPIPSVMIRLADGSALSPHLAGGVTVTLDAANLLLSDTAPDQMASFSSRGPSAVDGTLKPDLSAPGFSILSAGVGSGSDPRETSGTSMACPMAAGAAAVLRSVHPSLSPIDIKAMMMNTTAPLANQQGIPVPVSLGGAGRIRVVDSASQPVTAAASKSKGAVSLSYGAVFVSEPTSKSLDLTVTNHGDKAQSFTLSAEPTFPLDGASISLNPNTISVAPKSSVEVQVSLHLDPDQLPKEKPDPHTPVTVTSGNQTSARHFLTEFGGHVVLDGEQTLRVPFHAIVRAAGRQKAGTFPLCLDENDIPNSIPIDIPIEGDTAQDAPVISVFEHALHDPVLPITALTEPYLDIIEVGIANDLTSKSFQAASVYIAVSVNGDWTTPAKGSLSSVGIGIDTTGDQVEDYYVYAEPSSPYRFQDVLRSVTYRLSNGQRSGRALLNVFPPDELNTQPFMNNVLVFPVPLQALQELKQDEAVFSFRVFTQRMAFPQRPDRTDWITYDPHRAPVDTSLGRDGTPVFGPGDPIQAVFYPEHFKEEAPSLLFLHHTNEPGHRTEVVSLSGLGVVYPSDLSVSQEQPAPIEAGQTGSWAIEITNENGTEARNVKLALSVTEDAIVEKMQVGDVDCTGSECIFPVILPGETVAASVTVQAGTVDFEAHAVVQGAADCEMDPSNNEAFVTVEVPASESVKSEGQAEVDGGLVEPVNDIAQYELGGGCSCGTTGTSSSSRWQFFGLLGALGLISCRRKR